MPCRSRPASKRIAVIGPLADSAEDIKGSWTLEAAGAAVSVLEGVRARWPQATVDFVRGGDMQRAYPLPWDAEQGKPAPSLMPAAEMAAEQARAVQAAQQAEAVVMVLGERANMSGEAASTSDLRLGGNQQALLEAVVATGKPVVLVLLNGRPLDISWPPSTCRPSSRPGSLAPKAVTRSPTCSRAPSTRVASCR